MSHIGNKIKAGYFRTPDLQGEYIRKLLSFPHNTAAFDPTCGEGLILDQLTNGHEEIEIRTYGVELDKGRAAEANKHLDTVIQAPIESMVISHNVFGLLFLNPPYDHTMLGVGDDKSERKEYTELVRNTRYLAPNGIMVYIIPSYRFADKKIARFLSSQFEDIAITKFSQEEYEEYKQCVFIGKKKESARKSLNDKLFSFLQLMDQEEHINKHVTPLDQLVGRKNWEVPSAEIDIATFYTKLESKSDFISAIQNNKGFHAFKERTKPRQLEVGGNPIINIATGQLALLLASGAVNGIIGEGDTLHAVQGMEVVSKIVSEEKTEHASVTKSKTKRDVSVKLIIPSGKVKKLV
ncbi:hypothetical protein B14911_10712 [Bacillus sp. NRRL B-14911]|uniref:DUF6094 domain-containing protein n=1 Tax=Bacillus sp. NRRL B-14911 TaxID=313627 RepID=UPI00006B59BE|nr:DUF6094 domain-containing protein [Bacillus sp. NRRL B-14911]EAR66200.1 hypothetical protein B14911_10712 [Bacillus sp. NRRL B-14911]